MRQVLTAALAGATLIAAGPMAAQAQNWKPTKPITVIVPWPAGGATDQVTRITAKELEAALGTTIVVVNQPGASGSIGKKSVADGPKDGYTWTAGAPKQLGTYKLLGLYDTDVKNWHLFLNVTNVPLVSVKPDAAFKDMGELLAAMKARPNQISVGTAGATSSGHIAMEAIAQAAGVTYKHVTYDGGNPAVVSTVAGETMVTTQLASEQAEMIRGKRLRPLAVVGSVGIELGDYKVEPVTKWVAKLPEVATHFGIIIPKGVPGDVIATLEKVWAEKISKSSALQKYAGERGALFTPFYGEDAQKRVWPTIQADAWMLHAAGRTKMSPEEAGIPKP
jgi:tripartite-type tricarboxylate transporter receptor subunit TctC